MRGMYGVLCRWHALVGCTWGTACHVGSTNPCPFSRYRERLCCELCGCYSIQDEHWFVLVHLRRLQS